MSYAFRSPSTLSLLRELDNALTQAENNNSHSSRHGLPHMHCDVAETKDAFVIQADLPGVPKDDISVSVDKNVLTIQAKKVSQADEDKKADGSRFHIQERRTGKVSRSFELPSNVDFDSASSALENGVLSVTIKKIPAPAPRKLQIQ